MPHYWSSVRKIQQWSMVSPHKELVMRRVVNVVNYFQYSVYGRSILIIGFRNARDVILMNFQMVSNHTQTQFFGLSDVTWESWHPISPHLQWRHNGVSNHRRLDCLLGRLSKLRVPGHCEGNPPVTGASPHDRPVTRKMCLFDYVIMRNSNVYQTSCAGWQQNIEHDHWPYCVAPFTNMV